MERIQDAVRDVSFVRIVYSRWGVEQTPAPKVNVADIDYNLWLGPAPDHEFDPNRLHSRWRWYWDYGLGVLGDKGLICSTWC